ncbi:hypothetical protein P43SY_004316 [Pythium insidiosum]|uniref:Uncharacterized protein n=1 Tax=Pythium insidiosum TaxID=114742 RepID=A0AAD5LSP2_PYTIN|nr:hypothetical protein P43SY_004316 [Pythium insidiosum]
MTLQAAFADWKENGMGPVPVRRAALPEAAASCAALSYSFDDTHDDVHGIGEVVRVVELLGRRGLDPALLQRLVGDDDCPLRSGCAYCDGLDTTVRLELHADCEPGQLQDALLDWDETQATARFRRLKAAVEEATGAPPSPILLELHVVDYKETWSSDGDEIGSFLERYKQDVARDPRALFRLTSVHPDSSVESEALAAIARSQLPLACYMDSGCSRWKWALAPFSDDEEDDEDKDEDEDDEDKDDDASSTSLPLVAACNITQLRVVMPSSVSVFERMLDVLRSQPTALRNLKVKYSLEPRKGGGTAEQERLAQLERLLRMLVDSILSRRSALRLHRLEVQGGFSDDDVAAMAQRLASEPTTEPVQVAASPARYQELSLVGWRLRRGESLSRWLELVGGADNLKVQSGTCLQVAETAALAECRRLDVEFDPDDWSGLPSSVSDDDSAAPSTTRLEELVLRPSGKDNAVLQHAISRLVQDAGRPLRSLAIKPRSKVICLGGDVAKSIVENCPAIETLKLHAVDRSFAEQLAASLRDSDACRLQHLTVHSARPMDMVAPLLAALAEPTHPLSRSLRSLRLKCCYKQCGDLGPLHAAVTEMLSANTRLRDVVIHAFERSVTFDASATATSSHSIVVAPLRHRLALVSALQQQQQQRPRLPQSVVETVLEMAGRRRRRLRLEIPHDP